MSNVAQRSERSMSARRKKAALDGLRERELSCSNSVTESLQKRDRARVGLQSAMREQESR